MGWFKKSTADPAEIERLKGEIEAMSARLQADAATTSELDTTVRSLVDRLNAPSPPPPEPPPTPAPTVDPAEIDKVNARIERLSTRIDASEAAANEAAADDTAAGDDTPAVDPAEVAELGATMQRISERIDELDQRITAISTELANQITELSGDVETMGGNEPATDEQIGEVVDELRDAQSRLANEQARYQIAFRQDLAELADRLRRA